MRRSAPIANETAAKIVLALIKAVSDDRVRSPRDRAETAEFYTEIQVLTRSEWIGVIETADPSERASGNERVGCDDRLRPMLVHGRVQDALDRHVTVDWRSTRRVDHAMHRTRRA